MVRVITSETEFTDEKSAHADRNRARRIPTSVWLPLAIFAATRAFDFVVLVVAAKSQPALSLNFGQYLQSPMPASPGYLGVITNWDGQWYKSIAVDGYQMPAGDGSDPNRSWAWAFLPLFPMLVRAFMWLTGMGFAGAATVVNLTAGAAAMLVMYKLLEKPGGRFLAASGVALSCTFITAPILQAAYSEALALLMVCCALLMIRSHRYGWAFVAIVLLSLTRLITPALTIVVVVHVWNRLKRRSQDPFSAAESIWLFVLGLVSIGGVWLWSTFVNLRFGPGTDASTRAQNLANHSNLGWFSGLQSLWGWPGTAFLVIVSISLVYFSASASVTGNWGLEVRTWLCTYPIFILAVTPVTAGVVRYLLLAFPLPLLVVPSSPPRGTSWARISILVGTCLSGLVLQVLWINYSFVFDATPTDTIMP